MTLSSSDFVTEAATTISMSAVGVPDMMLKTVIPNLSLSHEGPLPTAAPNQFSRKRGKVRGTEREGVRR